MPSHGTDTPGSPGGTSSGRGCVGSSQVMQEGRRALGTGRNPCKERTYTCAPVAMHALLRMQSARNERVRAFQITAPCRWVEECALFADAPIDQLAYD